MVPSKIENIKEYVVLSLALTKFRCLRDMWGAATHQRIYGVVDF